VASGCRTVLTLWSMLISAAVTHGTGDTGKHHAWATLLLVSRVVRKSHVTVCGETFCPVRALLSSRTTAWTEGRRSMFFRPRGALSFRLSLDVSHKSIRRSASVSPLQNTRCE